MWDLLDVLFSCLELLGDGLNLQAFWRFSLFFFGSLILAGILELASSRERPLRATSIVLIAALAGAYWEWSAHRRGW